MEDEGYFLGQEQGGSSDSSLFLEPALYRKRLALELGRHEGSPGPNY